MFAIFNIIIDFINNLMSALDDAITSVGVTSLKDINLDFSFLRGNNILITSFYDLISYILLGIFVYLAISFVIKLFMIPVNIIKRSMR